MNIWFMGNGFFASKCLESISNNGISPSLVITAPPRPSGRRGLNPSPTPVEISATELSLNVHRTSNVNSDPALLKMLNEDRPSCIFVIDFGQKVGEPFLSSPTAGCLNLHPSLLPAYRGAAPAQRAIMDGHDKTGVTVFRLVEKMDAGPILLQEAVDIGHDETAGELLFRLAYIGGVLLSRGVKSLIDGEISLQPQNSSLATYARKIDKKEAFLSWNLSAISIHCIVRALNPSPGAYFYLQERRVKLWKTEVVEDLEGEPGMVFLDDCGYPMVKCSCGGVKLVSVQPEGKRVLTGLEWIRGSLLSEGDMMS